MNYKAAYLTMFGLLTKVTEQLEELEPGEKANVPLLLKAIQAQGEEACIAEKEQSA